MKKILMAVLALILTATGAQAQSPVVHQGPVSRLVRGVGHEFKRTFYSDFKEHPISHGLNMGARVLFLMADAGSTCYGRARGFVETNRLIGRYPSCSHVVGYELGYVLLTEPAVNYISHDFEDTCKQEASDPNSKWWKAASHTKSTRPCYWGPQLGYTIAIGAIEVPAVVGNIKLLERK